MAIEVTEEVLQGIRAVRDSGLTNMLDRPQVVALLRELGYEEAAVWVSEHRDLYARGIFQGFAAAARRASR